MQTKKLIKEIYSNHIKGMGKIKEICDTHTEYARKHLCLSEMAIDILDKKGKDITAIAQILEYTKNVISKLVPKNTDDDYIIKLIEHIFRNVEELFEKIPETIYYYEDNKKRIKKKRIKYLTNIEFLCLISMMVSTRYIGEILDIIIDRQECLINNYEELEQLKGCINALIILEDGVGDTSTCLHDRLFD